MHWFKRDLRNFGIASFSMLFLLTCFALLPFSAASAHEEISEVATSATLTVQATPTIDATVTALNKEQLEQEVNQLKNQNSWSLWTNFATTLSVLVAVLVASFSIWRWRVDRQDAHAKDLKDRAETRFQFAVTALGDSKEEVRVNAAVLLRTFLHRGYEEFYTQTFDLAVTHLRLSGRPTPSQDQDDPIPLTSIRQALILAITHLRLSGRPTPSQDQDDSIPLTPIRQALILAFQEAFPLARGQHAKNADHQPTHKYGRSLNASNLPLDNADLRHARLEYIWMPGASLRNANLSSAKLTRAILRGADLREADFLDTDLSYADLSYADLRGVEYLEKALSLKGAILWKVEGLTQQQLEACQKREAIIDKDPNATSTQSTAASSPSSPSNDLQPSSAPSAQGSTPPPDPDGSSNTSSQQEPEA